MISVNFTSSLYVPLFSILLLLMLWALEISETMKSMETIVIHMCVQRRTRHGCFSWFCTEILVRSSLLAKTCVFHWLKATLINTCWCHFSSLRCTKHPSLSISTCSWVLLVRFFYSHLGSYLLCNKQPPWLPLSGFCVITKILSQTYPYFTFRVYCC